MTGEPITVKVSWDDEAGVYVATSEDIDGLVAEAENAVQLKIKVEAAIADLVELNGGEAGREIRLRFV